MKKRPRKILVDIDGTLADPRHRLHHIEGRTKDWDSFYADAIDDEPYEEITDLVWGLWTSGLYEPIFCTGRPESTREDTENWLEFTANLWAPEPEELLMRPDDDFRPDFEVKPELLEKAGIELDEIAFVLEDRDQVVAAWRDRGLRVLQVCDGSY